MENKRKVRAVEVRNATRQVRPLRARVTDSHTCTHPQSVTATQIRIQRSHKSADIFFLSQYPRVQRSRGAALYVKQLKSNAYMWHCKYKQEEEKSAHTPEAVYIKHWARLTGPVRWFCLLSPSFLSYLFLFGLNLYVRVTPSHIRLPLPFVFFFSPP